MSATAAVVWVCYAALNVAIAWLVWSAQPRRAAHKLVTLLFAANGVFALAVAGREVWGPLVLLRWAEALANAATGPVLLALPFVVPRRRLAPRSERLLLPVAAIVLAYGVVDLLMTQGAPQLPPGLPAHESVPVFVGGQVILYGLLVLGLGMFLAEYLRNPSAAQRDQVRFFLAAYVLKAGGRMFYIPFLPALVGSTERLAVWASWLVLGVALLAVPLALLASHALRWRRGAAARPLGQDAFLLGVVALGLALPNLGAPEEVEWLVLRPILFGYAMLRVQLLDVDLRERWWALGLAVLAGMAVAFVLVLRGLQDAGVDPEVAVGMGLFLALAAGGAAAVPLARRALAPAAEADARASRAYRAALEVSVLDGDAHASSHDRILRALRARLGVSEREHALLEAEVRSLLGRAGGELAPGRRFLGRYRIERLLGQGGFGRTFLAHDEEMERRVVLKVARLAGPEEARRVLREARIVARLQHPNIVTVHDVERVGEECVVVMEHVEGGSLAERLRGGALPWRDACAVADDMLAGLEAAHAEGIVHRDVKPGNILLTKQGRAKLADFGVARVPQGSGTASGLSLDGSHPGTVRYMSPEQVRGEPLDGRSDLYAAGAVLYEALAGKPYLDFEGLSDLDARLAVLEDDPELPLRGVPEAVNELLAQLLAKDPARRPADARTARRMLEPAVQGSPPSPPHRRRP